MSDETEEQKKLMRQIDISCVQAFHTMDEIDAMVELAKKYRLAAVFTLPAFSAHVAERLQDTREIHAGGVVSFPGGGDTTGQKKRQAKDCGGWLPGNRHGDESYGIQKPRIFLCKRELLAIREQVPSAIFKVIIEAPQLTEQEICQAVDLCVKGRADYVKTSTGWYPGCPSTVEQVRIMSREAAGRIQIKAAGGIRSLETIQEMQKAGCSRFGMGMRSVQNLIKSIYK